MSDLKLIDAERARELMRRLLPGAPDPTAAELRRHAEKFGTEAVKETAEEFGLEVPVGPQGTPKQRRRR